MQSKCLLFAIAAVVGVDGIAQSNSRGLGYDGALSNISNATYYGRRGGAYPNGEVGVAFRNELCNPGTIPIEWRAAMQPDHPMFGFLVTKFDGDRIVQISDWSYCKHAFVSLNSSSTCGGTCTQPPAGGAQLGVRCSDAYSAGNNADRYYLGPPEEIDPWLGVWNPVGSYFDRGDPDVGPPGNNNGGRSLSQSQVQAFDSVKNRVTIKEADLVGATGLHFQIYVIHQGEPVENRGNNIMSRPFGLTWNGSSWSASTTGTATFGSILTRWAGSSLQLGGNGYDDGRFAVAVKVTGPTNGRWHYEYAVQNIDNHRGGASFRVPVCAQATVSNLGFRDIDQDPLNQWIPTRSGGEIVWNAPANNPHNWNTILNFWFDCDAAPVGGNIAIDQARLGAGAATVTVGSQVPGTLRVYSLGNGCGTPAVALSTNGDPVLPNPGFAITVSAPPSTGVFTFFSFGSATLPLGNGCFQYLAPASLGTHGFLVTNGVGQATIPLGLPATLTPGDMYWQAVTLQTGGPALGEFNLSNGLAIRVGGVGCPQ